ncbi:MAG: DUF1501 domain-containing protein [Planctomycetota bacterium]
MDHCPNASRRELLQSAACGFAALAATGMGARFGNASLSSGSAAPPMYAPKAKRIIFLFMAGGPSHVDTFDHKPELARRNGQEIDFVGVRFNTFGKESKRRLLRPLWGFRQYGESGAWVSSLFPHVAQHVDKLCFLHGMHTEGVAHGPATLFLHTGATNLVRPSMGSWISYGLGTENENLPAFVTIAPSPSQGGPRNYASAFLPARHQGTAIGRAGLPFEQAGISHLGRGDRSIEWQRRHFEHLQELNRIQRRRHAGDDQLDATIDSFELAFRMQAKAPRVFDLAGESSATLARYGIDEKPSASYGRQCLLARRLAEAGVRFIQVNYSDGSDNPRWDQHSNMPLHAKHALATDKPVAGLLADLEERGLLEDTLVWWGGEFGRTPFSQGVDGRDHNPRGFTVWLAGGGVKQGIAYGGTDEIGHYAVENKIHMHDLHATILHLLGVDHERLTYRYAGRDFRLTDVHGRVVSEIVA